MASLSAAISVVDVYTKVVRCPGTHNTTWKILFRNSIANIHEPNKLDTTDINKFPFLIVCETHMGRFDYIDRNRKKKRKENKFQN